jgi:branched-chain amino acid transport system substrate-binding protein
MKKRLLTLMVALGSMLAVSTSVLAAETMYVPIPSYRVGPYAAGGTGYFGGILDYYNLINERDGGINGVKLIWSECETEYSVERGVECYKRLKDREGGAVFFDPLSVGISTALIETGRKDKMPIIAVNHGKTAGQRGDIFPYYFMPGINTYDEHSIMVHFIGDVLEGGRDNLKGKKIAMLYHGSPYGREAIDFMDAMCEKHGCTHHPLEVPHPGNEQQSQWLNIRKLKPDYVLLRGWGVMNPVAMQTAVRTGYPVSRLIGNIWSNSDEDVIPAGKAADGYQAITTHPAGTDFDVVQQIIKTVYGSGNGDLQDKSRLGSVYWNLGVLAGVVHTEALRIAQARFGNRALSSTEARWGFENLRLDAARIAELGATGLVPELNLTCLDHVGGHLAKFQQWDAGARQWNIVSDWIEGDVPLSQAIIDAGAEQYATDNKIVARPCTATNNDDDFDL